MHRWEPPVLCCIGLMVAVPVSSGSAAEVSQPAVQRATPLNLKPGLYDTRFTASLSGPGMPALPGGQQRRRLCLSAQDLREDPRKLIDRLLAQAGLRCVYKDYRQTPAGVSVGANCQYLALKSSGTAQASFMADRFIFASTNVLATPIGEGRFKINGRGGRIGACAKPASLVPAAPAATPLPPVSAPVPSAQPPTNRSPTP